MEDPTGGMWIYLIFFMIPLVRILPRMLRKYRRKNAGFEPEPEEKYKAKKFFVREPEPPRYTEEPEPPRYTEEPEPEPPRYTEEPPQKPEPDNKDGWMKKDDFK